MTPMRPTTVYWLTRIEFIAVSERGRPGMLMRKEVKLPVPPHQGLVVVVQRGELSERLVLGQVTAFELESDDPLTAPVAHAKCAMEFAQIRGHLNPVERWKALGFTAERLEAGDV